MLCQFGREITLACREEKLRVRDFEIAPTFVCTPGQVDGGLSRCRVIVLPIFPPDDFFYARAALLSSDDSFRVFPTGRVIFA